MSVPSRRPGVLFRTLTLCLALLLPAGRAGFLCAQTTTAIYAPAGNLMRYEIGPQGDTVLVDVLKPAKVYARVPKQKGREWRKYYKLVYNFNKVYPYALVGREMMAEVDSTLARDELKRRDRQKYIKDVERELFRLFEKDIRKMTISQGMVLMRLVDRECGLSPYEIIQNYEGGFAADFWQLVAKLFSADLKRKYDPLGEDRQIEELVVIWDSGDWEPFYWSIFWEDPPRSDVLERHLSVSSPLRRSKTR